MTTEFKVCNCNQTMPLDAAAGAQLGKALGTSALPVATDLCRREIGTYLSALDGVDDVVVACTQERGLFAELAQQKNSVAPLRFVNIRETGGWADEASDRKMQDVTRMLRRYQGLNVLPASTAGLIALLAKHEDEPLPSDRYVAVVTGKG